MGWAFCSMWTCSQTLATGSSRTQAAEDMRSIVSSYTARHAIAVHDPGLGYVVARYDCPLEVGNKLEASLNAFLWAVVTDRSHRP